MQEKTNKNKPNKSKNTQIKQPNKQKKKEI